jgi:FixJ family two-component response regulator
MTLKKVWIVDEERLFVGRLKTHCMLKGIEVVAYYDATSALDAFRKGLIEGALLVDVALAPGSNLSLFSRQLTEKFLHTGLVLAKQILEGRSQI